MKIQQIVGADDVHLDLEANEMVRALEAVAQRVAPDLGLDSNTVVHELLEREKLGSTSVGDGFAIPHCKISGLDRMVVALARFNTPFEFSAADGQLVRFFFAVLSPPDQPASHLQMLSQIARVLKRSEVRASFLAAPTRDDVLQVLHDAEAGEGL